MNEFKEGDIAYYRHNTTGEWMECRIMGRVTHPSNNVNPSEETYAIHIKIKQTGEECDAVMRAALLFSAEEVNLHAQSVITTVIVYSARFGQEEFATVKWDITDNGDLILHLKSGRRVAYAAGAWSKVNTI